MKKHLLPLLTLATAGTVILGSISGCQKSASSSEEEPMTIKLNPDEISLVAAAGFNKSWAEKTSDGNYLIEGDILLTPEQLKSMSGASLTNNFIIAKEEHYRTTNIVNAPKGSVRVITVSLGAGFPSYYSTGLDQALARYNNIPNLSIRFQRVATGGEIHISGANLGRSFGGCILGQSAGFPSGGNPAGGFTLSTSKCATSYISTADKADEVMAHEMGHCIGFRHTDYMNRSFSCGSGGNEGPSDVGAIWIDGTPTAPETASWMLACTNGNPLFTANDNKSLQTVYPF